MSAAPAVEGTAVWRPIVVAGVAVERALHEERERLVPKSSHWSGCYQSEPLVVWQRNCAARGFRDVELVESIYGWSVRSGSGMDDFALLASSRMGVVDGSYADAERWAARWCDDDPARRYAWLRRPEKPIVVRVAYWAGKDSGDGKFAPHPHDHVEWMMPDGSRDAGYRFEHGAPAKPGGVGMSHAPVSLPALVVRFDRVYGKVTCYPVNEPARLVAEFAATKTLRPRDLAIAQKMGFTVELAPGSQQLLEDFVAGRA